MRRSLLRPAFAMVLCLALGGASGRAEWFEFKEDRPGLNYRSASYRLHVSPSVAEPRGIVVVIPGYNEAVMPLVESGGWTGFADSQNYALLACEFQGDANLDYSNARRGSGQSVVRAIRALADLSGRRDLFNANLVLYGVSSGAQFAASFAQERPDQTGAFVSVLGAYWQPANAGSRKVAGLFVSAADQPDGAGGRTRTHVALNRRAGAYWAHLPLPSSRDATARSLGLAQDYLKAVIRIRQPEGRPPQADFERLRLTDGFALIAQTGAVSPAVDVPRPDLEASSWFPDEATARAALALARPPAPAR